MRRGNLALAACLLAALAHQAAAGRALLASPAPTTGSTPVNYSLPLALNSFGSKLYAAVLTNGTKSQSGAFLSPFSISQAMGMLLNGAEPGGQSYNQLLSAVFGAPQGSAGSVNGGMAALAGELLGVPADGNLTISNANSVWVDPTYTLQPAFEAAVTQYYEAAVEPITTAEAVNSWVANATQGKIDEIIDQETLDEMALLLINALYFKGLWTSPFDKTLTRQADFTKVDGSKLSVAMMGQSYEGLNAADGQVAKFNASWVGSPNPFGCVAVKLAYQGGLYSAVFAMPVGSALPAPGRGGIVLEPANVPYQAALSACQAELLARLVPKGSNGLAFTSPLPSLIVGLPRFEIKYETSLKEPLVQLGVTKPFDTSGPSDLTRLADEDGAPVTNLVVSDVIHKTYIKVDEKGTEAAAVTQVGITATAAPLDPPEVVTFDRPFTAAVVDETTGSALFVGQVQAPDKWAA